MISPKITPKWTKITPKYFPLKIFSPKFLALTFLVLNVYGKPQHDITYCGSWRIKKASVGS